jgi:hypothetical protein
MTGKPTLLLVAALLASAACGSESASVRTVTETVVSTTRVTEPSEEPGAKGLPGPVARTRAAILASLAAKDYEGLEKLIPADGFTYTYGAAFEGGPIAYWKEAAANGPDDPFQRLEAVLQLPYTLVEDAVVEDEYVWPFAYDRLPEDLTAEERADLVAAGAITQDQLDQMMSLGHYLGWRAGIRSDGTWIFFVAGD